MSQCWPVEIASMRPRLQSLGEHAKIGQTLFQQARFNETPAARVGGTRKAVRPIVGGHRLQCGPRCKAWGNRDAERDGGVAVVIASIRPPLQSLGEPGRTDDDATEAMEASMRPPLQNLGEPGNPVRDYATNAALQ